MPYLVGDRLKFESGYGIGGPGRRGVMGGAYNQAYPASAPAEARAMKSAVARQEVGEPSRKASWPRFKKRTKRSIHFLRRKTAEGRARTRQATRRPRPLRSNFSETAFWQPQLLTAADGSASIEFTVPDSVTSWKVFVHAVTKDLRGGSVDAETKTVKDLMVRPYVPRFLREGDRAEIKVVVNNASAKPLSGTLAFEITRSLHGEEPARRRSASPRAPRRARSRRRRAAART